MLLTLFSDIFSFLFLKYSDFSNFFDILFYFIPRFFFSFFFFCGGVGSFHFYSLLLLSCPLKNLLDSSFISFLFSFLFFSFSYCLLYFPFSGLFSYLLLYKFVIITIILFLSFSNIFFIQLFGTYFLLFQYLLFIILLILFPLHHIVFFFSITYDIIPFYIFIIFKSCFFILLF